MKSNTILFDINETVLDLSALKPKFKAVFGDEKVVSTWFSMLLHSSVVCSLTEVKSDFATLSRVMLKAIAAKLDVTLTDKDCSDILATFADLPAHSDIKPALQKLRSAGFRTIAFSNSSQHLITKQIHNAGLNDYFDDIVSVEDSGSFKPDFNVYQFAANRVHRSIDSLWLVATHDWDTHGAICAGMHAAYIDRSGIGYHPLYRQADIDGKTMGDVIEKIIVLNKV
ncbi:haloacid dehalogenase [Psychromonas marina]|uniref:(S)-2-haloacid dehalogenase n=1 Tax=Psychromonas marina TaxID=88364 RepID=A0ABQ6DVR1_9GAMM|nr:haloacid dehalogenase type II [Psychromonas marina]GLS89185.1 haloacid dehalogenase [Psychromonas marina]